MHTLRRIAALAAVAGAILAATPASAGANTVPGAPPTAASCIGPDGTPKGGCFSMLVTPAGIDVTPQDVQQHRPQTLTVWNNGTTDDTLHVSATEFTQNPDGSMQLGGADAPGDAGDWVTLNPATIVRLAPGHPATVTATVTIPPGAPPGDHNIAIVFRRDADNTAGSLTVAPQIAVKFLVQAPGPIRHDITLTDGKHANHTLFGLSQSGTAQRFTVKVTNSGTVHEPFQAARRLTATITGFGAPQAAALSVPDFDILRDTTLTVAAVWDHAAVEQGLARTAQPAFCWCKATFTTSNRNGGTTSQTISFVIFPIWQTALVIVLLAAIAFLLWYRHRKLIAVKTELAQLKTGRHQRTTQPTKHAAGRPDRTDDDEQRPEPEPPTELDEPSV